MYILVLLLLVNIFKLIMHANKHILFKKIVGLSNLWFCLLQIAWTRVRSLISACCTPTRTGKLSRAAHSWLLSGNRVKQGLEMYRHKQSSLEMKLCGKVTKMENSMRKTITSKSIYFPNFELTSVLHALKSIITM